MTSIDILNSRALWLLISSFLIFIGLFINKKFESSEFGKALVFAGVAGVVLNLII